MQIKFCQKKCSIVLKYIKDKTFRISFYIIRDVEGSFDHGLSIDLKFDQFSYTQFFKENNIQEILQKHQDLDENLFVKSHSLVEGRAILKRFKPSVYFLQFNCVYRYKGS